MRKDLDFCILFLDQYALLFSASVEDIIWPKLKGCLPAIIWLCSILCKPGTLDARKVKGKILICLRGDNARVDKGEQALLAGAVGMILANNKLSGNEIIPDPHVLPASHINYTDGVAVFRYVSGTK